MSPSTVTAINHRRQHPDGAFSDVVTFRFPPHALRLLDVDQGQETVKLRDIAHYRYVKALERGQQSPTIVTFSHLRQDQPVAQRFPGLSYTTEDGERLLSANSFITYTMRTLFRRGWICYDDGRWWLAVPDNQPQWQQRAGAVLQHLLALDHLYLETERETSLDFTHLPFSVDQDLVPVAGCAFLDDIARRLQADLAFNSAFFLLEHDDIFNRHSALCEAHSFWMHDGVIQRPPLFRRGAIWQHQDGRWQIGLLSLEDLRILLPNGLRLVHCNSPLSHGDLPFTLDDQGPSAVTLYTRHYGVAGQGRVLGRTPLHKGRLELTVVDRRIVGLKQDGNLTLPHNGFVISFAPGPLALDELETTLQHDLSLGYQFTAPHHQTVQQGLQTGPILLQGGQSPLTNGYLERVEQFWPSRTLPSGEWQIGVVPTSYKTDVDRTRAGRAGIGIDGDGSLILVMVAGVNDGMGIAGADSSGATLGELAHLLQEAGAQSALNLDGGGSTQAIYHGRQALVPGDRRGTPGHPYRRMIPSAGIVAL